MGQWFEEIGEEHANWIKKQKIFFVATAPLDGRGCVNTSPKGHDCLRVLGSNQVCYLELSGSGIETQSHLEENGRITVMFTAFEGGPRIMRLIGTGRVIRVGSSEFNQILGDHYEGSELCKSPGHRAIIMVDVRKVGTSCGFAVPFFEYKGQRPALVNFYAKKDKEAMKEYWMKKNMYSLDGLPGMRHEWLGEEWIGRNRGPGPVELPDWAIADGGGRRRTMTEDVKAWLKSETGTTNVTILSVGIVIGAGLTALANRRR